jgi:hypothetical protein
MNDASTSAVPSNTLTTPAHTDKPAVKAPAKPATKAASKAESTSKIPVKAPLKSASPAPKQKSVKTAAAQVTPIATPAPAAPAKTKPSTTRTAKPPQAKAADKKKTATPAKAAKEKKVKVVRDSFTLPKTELLQITEMKKRAMALGVEVKKSELIRAGLQALAGMADTAFKKAMANVPTIKTGRPAKD